LLQYLQKLFMMRQQLAGIFDIDHFETPGSDQERSNRFVLGFLYGAINYTYDHNFLMAMEFEYKEEFQRLGT
jgi:hypothetical protein